MAKIKQSVPSQANNQLNTHLTAGSTGLHSNRLLFFNQQQYSENASNTMKSLMLFFLTAPAIDIGLTKQNICSPEVVAVERRKILKTRAKTSY